MTYQQIIVVFVPFLGDFFSITVRFYDHFIDDISFRPLSWGLFFNEIKKSSLCTVRLLVFVPFLGDFFSIAPIGRQSLTTGKQFSSPFLGTFFQYGQHSIMDMVGKTSFRPLSWGLFFNCDSG